MPACPVCGDLLTPGARVCPLCGTDLAPGAATEVAPSKPAPGFDLNVDAGPSPASPVLVLPVADDTLAPPPADSSGPLPMALPFPESLPVALPAAEALPVAQAAGVRCLVLYGPDKKPLQSFPLLKDVTLIGRQDPLRGIFPDVNVDEWLDAATARQVSRKHALIFHTRRDDSFSLRPLAGNTGTQIEEDMVEALKDYPLRPGTRLILGGSVRFKLEVR